MCHNTENAQNGKWSKCQKHENDKMQNDKKCDHKTSKNIKNRRGLNPALKPGPVVPPGTQKTPDQAARISQSGDFAHLSDILAFLRGGRFLTLFLINFHDLCFVTFSWFWFSAFCCFLCFSDFDDFHVFDDLWFLINFCHFSCWWLIFVTFCWYFRCLIHDTLLSW